MNKVKTTAIRSLIFIVILVAGIVLVSHVKFHMTFEKDFKITQVQSPTSLTTDILYERLPVVIMNIDDPIKQIENVVKMNYMSSTKVKGLPAGVFVNRSKFAFVIYNPSTDNEEYIFLKLLHPRHKNEKTLPFVDIKLKSRSQALFVPTWWILLMDKEVKGLDVLTFDDFITWTLKKVSS